MTKHFRIRRTSTYVPVRPSMPTTVTPDIRVLPPSDQPHWHALLNILLTTTLTPGVDNALIPPNTNPLIIPAIDEAFDAGLVTGTGVRTAY